MTGIASVEVPLAVDAPARGIVASDARADAHRTGPRRSLALAGKPAFDRCLRQPAALRSAAFALHVALDAPPGAVPQAAPQPLDAAADPAWRLGLVIPKRYEPSAVARNTIKRRWRGAFRDGRVAWAREFGAADVVVRMHGPLVKKADRDALPAVIRGRHTFDPHAAFSALAARLRSRSSRIAVAK